MSKKFAKLIEMVQKIVWFEG